MLKLLKKNGKDKCFINFNFSHTKKGCTLYTHKNDDGRRNVEKSEDLFEEKNLLGEKEMCYLNKK